MITIITKKKTGMINSVLDYQAKELKEIFVCYFTLIKKGMKVKSTPIDYKAQILEKVIKFYIDKTQKNNPTLIIFPAKKAFNTYTQLALLKRDNYTFYSEAIEKDIIFLTFDSFENVKKYFWKFKPVDKITLWVYFNGHFYEDKMLKE